MSASGSLLIPPLIHSILDRQKEVWRAARGKYWALLNVVFLACLVGWDPSPALLSSFLPASARTQRLLWMFRGSLIFVCVLNLFYHGWKLLFPWGRGQKDLVITQEQMDLMHIARERHPGFQVSPKSASGPRHPNPFKPLPGSFMSSPAYGSPSSLNTSSQSPR